MTKVYAAEDSVFGGRRPYEAVSFVDARALVAKYDPTVTVKRRTRRRELAWAGPGKLERRAVESQRSTYFVRDHAIAFGADVGMAIVLHEIAHALTPEDGGHGPAFRAVYVWLVEVELGAWWARRLRAAFRKAGYR